MNMLQKRKMSRLTKVLASMDSHKFIIFLVTLSLASSLIPVHRTPYDYGWISHTAERAFQGGILYRDFAHYFAPGRVYGPAVFYLLFGITTYSLILYFAFFNILISIVLFHISKHISNSKLFIHFLPIAYIYFVQPSLYVGSDRLFFPILTIFLIYNYYSLGKSIWLYLSGLSLGAAYLFSYEVAFLVSWPFIIFIVLKSGVQENRFIAATFAKNLKRLGFELIVFITGTLTLAVPGFLYFLEKAGFRDMFYWLIWVPVVAYSLSIPLTQYFTNPKINILVEGVPLYLQLIAYMSFIIYLVYKLIFKKDFSKTNLSLLLVLLFGLFLFKVGAVRSDHSHFMLAVTPALVLLIFSTIEIVGLLKTKYRSARVRGCVSIFLAMVVICTGVYGEYEWVMYFGRRSDYVWLEPGRGCILVHRKWGDDLNRVVRYVSENTKDGDYIFVTPDEPYIYFLSKRNNPTKYESYYKGEVILEKQLEVIKNLEEKKPRLVIFGRNFKADFPENYKGILIYIYDKYQRKEVIGKYEVYILKADRDLLSKGNCQSTHFSSMLAYKGL